MSNLKTKQKKKFPQESPNVPSKRRSNLAFVVEELDSNISPSLCNAVKPTTSVDEKQVRFKNGTSSTGGKKSFKRKGTPHVRKTHPKNKHLELAKQNLFEEFESEERNDMYGNSEEDSLQLNKNRKSKISANFKIKTELEKQNLVFEGGMLSSQESEIEINAPHYKLSNTNGHSTLKSEYSILMDFNSDNSKNDSDSEVENSIDSLTRTLVDTDFSGRVPDVQKADDLLDDSSDSSTEDIEEIESSEESYVEEENIIDVPEEIQRGVKYISKMNKTIVIIDKHRSIYLFGMVSLKVIHGMVEILGHILDPNSDAVELYSPRGTAFLSVKTLEDIKETDFIDYKTVLKNLGFNDSDTKEVIDSITSTTTILFCEKLEKPVINFVEKYVSQIILPNENEHNLRCVFRESPLDWNVFKTSSEWNDISECVDENSRIFLCGGKGVGKSTLLRYLINKMLMEKKEIRVVDLDPGQPEFTVPGCVSIITVTKPIFGPNYTHLTKTEKSIFVPNIDIAFDKSEYISCIQQLLTHLDNSKNISTLVNYAGFTKGIGLHIVSAVIAEVNPTLVVQIESSNPKKNFKTALTAEYVAKEIPSLSIEYNVKASSPSYTFKKILSLSDAREGWNLESRQVREMCILAYLSKMLPPSILSLTSTGVRIFRISLSDVKLISNGAEVSPAVENANLVALCSWENKRNDLDLYACYGWGVVRGVDLVKNELFLLTPESEEVLDNVDLLVHCSVNLPPSVYMTADDVDGLVPFVSVGFLTSFSAISKRSHLPKEVTMGHM